MHLYDYNYKYNGKNWPREFSNCEEENDQAPINLKSKFSLVDDPWPMKLSVDETIFVTKTNPKNVKINWAYNQTTTGDLKPYY